MNKTPEITRVLPGHRYDVAAIRCFGAVACGQLDAFGFIYELDGRQQLSSVLTESQGQGKQSWEWLGTRVSQDFIKDAEDQVRQVHREVGIDYRGPLRFTGKLSRQWAGDHAERIRSAIEHNKVAA